MTQGMVCAPQPEAVEAGVEVLRAGGNAVDAAIACALVQTVVDPFMCGIAGFGSLQVVLPARGTHEFIDFHGRAPLATREDMWQDRIEGEAEDGFGFVLEGRVNDMGYQSITVPGSLKAYGEALERFGTWALSDVMAPAIEYAETGFAIRPHMAFFWNLVEQGRVPHRERLGYSETGRRLYLDGAGAPRKPGEWLRNPDLAETYRRIADQGIEAFYEGEIARRIAADMAEHGGLLSMDDLVGYRTEDAEPLWGSYRGYRIATNRPPGGGIMLLEMLNILECFDLAGMGHNSPDMIAVLAEAMKRATSDKDRHVGDPRFFEVPFERLLDKGYAAEQAEAMRRGEKHHVERLNSGADLRDTTHVSVADEAGNCVSLTHSLGMTSGVITDGLGFMYNNCMSVFDPRPGRAGSLKPGRARFSAMSPTIVFKDERPVLIIGAPGGTFITMGVLQGILNVLDFGMSALEAVAAPRICVTSDVIDIVNRIPRSVEREVAARGYALRRSHLSYHFAGVHAIRLIHGPAGIRWDGGADPGRDGMAMEA